MSGYAEPNLRLPQPAYNTAELHFAARSARRGPLPYALLLIFVALLYSQLSLLLPAVDVIRPAYAVGGAAIVILIVQRLRSGEAWDFVMPQSPLLLALIGTAALSSFDALWMRYAAHNTLELAKMVALYFLIINCVSSGNQLRRLIWVMVLGGLLPAIGTLNNYFQGHVEQGRAGWIGIFSNPNELAYSLLILIPLAAYLAANARMVKAALLWMIVATYVAAIFVSFSRGGMLGLLAILVLMGFKSRRASMRALAAVLIIASVIFLLQGWSRSAGFTRLGDDPDVQSRLRTIWGGLMMFADHPLTGVGLGCSVIAWPLYAPADANQKWLIIHNTFVQALSEMGIAGFLAFSLLFLATFSDCRKIARRPASPNFDGASTLATSIESSLWGFVVCAMAGGFILTWFPYFLVALASALKKITGEHAAVHSA